MVAGSTVVDQHARPVRDGPVVHARRRRSSRSSRVLVVMAASITLFPALLGYLGRHVDRLRLPLGRRATVAVAAGGHVEPSRGWLRLEPAGRAAPGRRRRRRRRRSCWRWPRRSSASASASPTPATTARARSTRQAYDTQSPTASGPGSNGPLLLVAELPASAGEQARSTGSPDALRVDHGVAAVTPPTLNPAGDTAVFTVIPTTGPQDPAHRGPRAPRCATTSLPDGDRRHRPDRARRRRHRDLDRQHPQHRQADPAAHRRRGAALDAAAAGVVPQRRGRGQGGRDEPAVRRRGVRRGRAGPAGRLGRPAGRHRHRRRRCRRSCRC